MNYRPKRVGKLIREELSKIILREVDFPEGALVTITEVYVSSKMDNAKVRLSVLPSSFEDKVLFIAKKNAGNLQYLLLKKLNIRPMPRIEFEIDHGLEDSANIEKLLLDK